MTAPGFPDPMRKLIAQRVAAATNEELAETLTAARRQLAEAARISASLGSFQNVLSEHAASASTVQLIETVIELTAAEIRERKQAGDR